MQNKDSEEPIFSSPYHLGLHMLLDQIRPTTHFSIKKLEVFNSQVQECLQAFTCEQFSTKRYVVKSEASQHSSNSSTLHVA